MLAIKLRPVGKKKQISYRIVIGEKRSKLKGESIEDIGWYNPHTNKFSVKNERAQYWIKSGAVPTDSVHNIFVTAKIIDGPKIQLHKKSWIPEKPVETSSQPEEKKDEEVKEEKVEEVAAEVVEVEEAPQQETQQEETKEENTEAATEEVKEEVAAE